MSSNESVDTTPYVPFCARATAAGDGVRCARSVRAREGRRERMDTRRTIDPTLSS
jgi:hypothetical protein